MAEQLQKLEDTRCSQCGSRYSEEHDDCRRCFGTGVDVDPDDFDPRCFSCRGSGIVIEWRCECEEGS